MHIVDASPRPTPFHGCTAPRVVTGQWYGWGDYVLPDVYTSLGEELGAIRNAAALIDMTPLPKLRIAGEGAPALLDRAMTRPVGSVARGRCIYSPWCLDDGRMVGDGIVFHRPDGTFLLAGERSLGWLRETAGNLDVTVEDVTHDFGVLALQGPRAPEIAGRAVGADVAGMGFSEVREVEIGGAAVMLARQGFTGEKGYEVWVRTSDGAAVWTAIMEAGAADGLKPAGEYAVDVARVEAGLILVSADYAGAGPDGQTANVAVDRNLTLTPAEAGLARLVPLDDEREFRGRDALRAEAERGGPERRWTGLRIEPDAVMQAALAAGCPDEALSRVLWASVPASVDGTTVGRASSLCYSPTLGAVIGFAFVTKAAHERGAVEVDMRSPHGTPMGRVPATLVAPPFVELRRSA